MPSVEASDPWVILERSRMMEITLRAVSPLRVEMTPLSSSLNLPPSNHRPRDGTPLIDPL
jgi:hypothetical protein